MPALILLSYVSLLSLSLLDNLRGPFYPDILSDLGVSATQGSLFFAVVNLFAVGGSFGSHYVLGRLTSVRLLALASLGLAGGFAAIAFSPGLDLVLVSCALFGLSYGVLNLLQNVLIYQGGAAHMRRRLFAGLHSMYGLSALGAPLLAAVLREAGWNWRPSFLLVAAFPALIGIWAFAFRREHAASESKTAASPLGQREWRHCVLYALALAIYLWGELSISTRLPLWLRREKGYTPEEADVYLALFFLALLSGRMVFSFLNLRRVSNWVVLAGSAGLGALLYTAGLMWEPKLLLVTGLALSPFYPVLMDQAGLRFGPKSSQALGFIIATGSLGVMVMHVVIGAVNDHSGLTMALQLCAGLLFVLAMGLLARVTVAKPGRELTV